LRNMLVAAACLAVIVGTAHAGDVKNGQQAFTTCRMCHTAIKGGPNGVGPNLWGVAGRKAASLPGFYYSAALKGSHITWTNDKLKVWIMGPQKLVPGNRMAFAGVRNAKTADDIVAYLASLK